MTGHKTSAAASLRLRRGRTHVSICGVDEAAAGTPDTAAAMMEDAALDTPIAVADARPADGPSRRLPRRAASGPGRTEAPKRGGPAAAATVAAMLGVALLTGHVAHGQDKGTDGGGPGDLTPAQVAAIDAIGRISIAGRYTPSVTIAVTRDGREVYAKGFGYRDLESRVPPVPATRYPIESNTKQFTAAAILLLQDEGSLKLDDPLSMYLPDYPHAREVTLRQLLDMTSGYYNSSALEQFDILSARYAPLGEVVAAVADQPLTHPPGAVWEYTNTAYALLALVIEERSKMPYAEFFRRRFFVPLGMTSTYVPAGNRVRRDVATTYVSFALGPWEHSRPYDYSWTNAAGAIHSDVADLEKWNEGLDGGHLLSPSAMAEMFTPAGVEPNPSYALGLMIKTLPNGHREIYHGGDGVGSASQDARFPDDRLAIIILANARRYEYNQAVDAIYNVLVPQVAPPPPAPPPLAAPAADPAIVQEAIAWLDDAIAGNIDPAKLRGDMARALTPERRAYLRALAKLGRRSYTLTGVSRLSFQTIYDFNVIAGVRQLRYFYARQDGDGAVTSFTEVVKRLVLPTAPPSQ